MREGVSGLVKRGPGWLGDEIVQHLSRCSWNFSLALAGGSSPRALYQLLADSAGSSQVDWCRVLFLWGDERNVATDHADSNARMVRESLLASIQVPAANILSVPNPGGDAKQAARQYEGLLRDRLPQGEDGFSQIDCVLLGMGDDVHTASLFPQTAALNETEAWVSANFVSKLNAWRITMTAPLINSARDVAFLIAGSSKTTALQTLWYGPYIPEQYPAQMIQPKAGDLTYFVDRPAIGSLSIPPVFRIFQ